jgi:hypothetical protein
MTDIPALHRFLRHEFDVEAQRGFARVRRIPDTGVRHFLDYYTSLSTAEQDALADAVTLRGALGISEPVGDEHWQALSGRGAWQRWLHETVAGVVRDPHFYYSVPILRAAVAQANADRARGWPSSVPEDTVEYAKSIQAIKTPELRKRLRECMTVLFGPGLASVGNRSADYEGTLNGSHLQVGFDLGGQYWQLGYQVAVESADCPGRLARAGFEMTLGIGQGHWDFITEENVDDSFALLCEFVGYVAELPRRLAVRLSN